MSATSPLFQVTETSSGTTSDISGIDIVLVTASGSGSKINYMKDGATPVQLIVTESPSTVSTASKYLIALTDTATSATFYVNADRIRNVFTNGSAANVQYDQGLGNDVMFAVNQTRAAIRILQAAIISSGGSGSVTTGLTAGATQTQVGATELSYGYNEVTTVTTAGDGVRLPAGIVGAQVIVLNDGVNTMQVYPATSGKINDGTVNVSINQAPGTQLTYVNIDGTNWESGTQVVELGAGTAALPSLTFFAQTNMGWHKISATQLGASVSGALVGGWDASGLFTGNIAEQVGGAGVTIDSVLLKDGGVGMIVTAGTKGFSVVGTAQSANDLCTISATTAVTSAALMKAFDTVLTTTGASAVNMIEVSRFTLTSAVQNGNWANAIVGKIDFSTTGYVTGLAGVICAELDMPTTSPAGGAGTYTCYEAEINMAGLSGGVPISVINANVWGAQATDFDTNGYLFDITGVVAGIAGGTQFFTANTDTATHGLKVRVNGTPYWITLTPATV